MQRAVLLLLLLVMVGCLDTGRAGFDPQRKPPCFNAHSDQVQPCLDSAAISQPLSLDQDIRYLAGHNAISFNKVTVPLSPGSK